MIDKDAIINELKAIIKELKEEMDAKDACIKELKQKVKKHSSQLSIDALEHHRRSRENSHFKNATFAKFDNISQKIAEAEEEEKQWICSVKPIEPQTKYMSEQEMREIFDEFDENGEGNIDALELQNALSKMGQDMPLDEVKNLISEVDGNGNGLVDFTEFKEMAAKGWFVAAFQSRLIDELMNKLTFEDKLDDDDDSKSDEEAINVDVDDLLSDDDKLDVISDKSNDYEELLEQTTMKTQRIEDLVYEMQASKEQNQEISRLKTEMNIIKEMYENKLMDKLSDERSLKRRVEELESENHKLKDDVNVLEMQTIELEQYKEENDRLLEENKENSQYSHANGNGFYKGKAHKIDKWIEQLQDKLAEKCNNAKVQSKRQKTMEILDGLRQKMDALERENDRLRKQNAGLMRELANDESESEEFKGMMHAVMENLSESKI